MGRDATVLGSLSLAIVYLLPRRIDRVLAAIPAMVQAALVLALLGSIDSLLTSLIADNIGQTHHDSDRELIGQGIGNTLAGIFGAIPGAGATMRTVVNLPSGGRTPISGALHALVLLAVVLGIGGLARHIPHAVLTEAQGRIVLYHLSGPFSFGAARGMARRLAAADAYDALVFDLADVPFLDSSASLALEDAITQAQARGKQVYLVGARPEIARTLAQLGVDKQLPDGHQHVSRLEALRHAAADIAANSDPAEPGND